MIFIAHNLRWEWTVQSLTSVFIKPPYFLYFSVELKDAVECNCTLYAKLYEQSCQVAYKFPFTYINQYKPIIIIIWHRQAV